MNRNTILYLVFLCKQAKQTDIGIILPSVGLSDVSSVFLFRRSSIPHTGLHAD